MENNQQNLEETYGDQIRHKCMKLWEEFRNEELTIEQLVEALRIVAGFKPEEKE